MHKGSPRDSVFTSCVRQMNRSFISVIAGGFGQEVVVSDGDEEQGNTCKHQIKMGWIC
ncbi:hypothetical protein O9929_25375 [Vibrio lentus]|nr:hypothetical protein [Vibrio lentus]